MMARILTEPEKYFAGKKEEYIAQVKQKMTEGNRIAIYGAGEIGKKLYRFLQKENIPVEFFCVTDPTTNPSDTGAQEISPQIQLYGGHGEVIALQLLVSKLGLIPSAMKYIEIGTNDPIQGNNSYFLYAAGARGLLVDPMPIVADLVKIFRPEDRFLQVAVTDIAKQSTAIFYESNTLSSSSLHENFQKDFDPSEKRYVTKSYEVRLIGINELI